MANLRETYQSTVVPALREKFALANPMMVPRVTKVVVNMGFGILDKDAQKSAVTDLTKLTGQQPALRKARKSISNFKLREGMVVGAMATLRGARMYEFLERFIHIALPRIRDFRGVPERGFDGRGNYTLGIKDQTIFPEIDVGHGGAAEYGMDITIVTTAKTDAEARELLAQLGFPFAGRKSGE